MTRSTVSVLGWGTGYDMRLNFAPRAMWRPQSGRWRTSVVSMTSVTMMAFTV